MRNTLKLALLAAMSFTTQPTWANEQTDDDLVVTGTRQPAEAARLPADIDVIDIDEARSRGTTSIADALDDTPGLGVVNAGSFGQQTSLFSGGANSNHTLVLFDGIRINDPSTPGSSFDAGQDTIGGLGRIEVVQGPMSAVFGSDAIGGVVNILPRHGRAGAVNGELDIRGGSLGTHGALASVDGTIGRLRYAFTGEGFVTEGYDLVPARIETHTGDQDAAESSTFTAILDLDVTNRFALDLLLRHREARADFDAFIFPPPSFSEQRADDADLEIAQNDLTMVRLGANWRLTDVLSLRMSAGSVEQDREEHDGGVTTATFQGNRRFADLAVDWRFAETGVLSNAGVLAGIERQSENTDIDQGFAAVAGEQEHVGAFITAQGDIGNLTLTAAARIDDFDGFGTETTWRVGASHIFANAFRIYAAYGTSFRAPTLYERFVSWGNPDLNPERGAAWEIGGGGRFAAFGQGDGLEFGLLYRSTEIEDLIDFSPAFVYANVDQAEIKTAEARVAVRPTSWLTARIAYIYTDARDIAANTPLLRRPEDAWLASLDVERGPFTAQLSWRSVGERPDQIYGADGFWRGVGTTPQYDVLRVSAAWDVTLNAQVYIAADNLADEAYEPVNAFAGAPRTVMAGIRLRP